MERSSRVCGTGRFVLTVTVAAVLCASVARAQESYFWQGAGTGGTTGSDPSDPNTQWSNPANWQGGELPAGGTVHLTMTNDGYCYAAWAEIDALDLYTHGSDVALVIGEGVFLLVDGQFLVGSFPGFGPPVPDPSAPRILQTGGSISATQADLAGGLGGRWFDGGLYVQTGGTACFSQYLLVSSSTRFPMYQLKGGTLVANACFVGSQFQGGVLAQTGGFAAMDYLSVSCAPKTDPNTGLIMPGGSYELSGGSLASRYTVLGGEGMMGLFAQEGGAHTAGTLTILGASTTGPVTYLLHEGSVTVTGAERIRDGGSFVQTGGLNRCERRLVVADYGSRYDLAGGSLWAANGTVGQGGTAGFTQSGGAATFQDQLVLGYEPGSTGTYTLSGGSLSAASGTIGYRGIGEFNQSGGTANFTGELILGHEPGSTGTYALSGGSLAATSATIGYNGAGVFCQTGGTASVGEELRVGYSAGPGGTYELAGGSLGTPACWVANGGFCQAGGLATVDSLRLGGGPRSPITGLLEITQARYELAAGSLRTRSTDLAPGGVLCQMGGTAKMDYLYVMSAAFLADPPGQYELCGGSLLTGSTRAGGTFYQAGGTHTTSELTVSPTSHVARGPAIYKLEGGLLQATGGMTINRGALHQSGGMSLVGSPGFVVGGRPVWIGGKLVLGSSWLTQAGTYVLEDGLLVAGSEYIGEGPGGTGLFVQNGGMHQTKGSLMLGFESPYAGHWAYGRYDLSGGSFSAGRGTIGYRGIGEFNQSGGTANFTDVLILGRESSGTGRYALSGGSLRAGAGVVGSQGYGAFTQSGGTASFDRSLLVAYSGSGTGTYELSGGELHTWKTMVGPQGQFIQTGGLHTGWVGVDGRYLLSGGSLRARSLYVVNEFALGRWADLSIDRDLNFGHSGAHSPVFHAEPFSSVHMTGPGARVANYSTDPSGLADLGQLWMIFEASGAYLGSFEAAGKDLGPVADGYQENFALGVLELAGEGLGRRFTLTDTFDNQPDWSGCEALYLDTLILHQGVMLDPAGLSLYYRNHQANVKRFFVADVDLDGAVDGGDLALMSGSWGRGDGLADRVHGDLNGDGMVNGSDLALLGGEWGRRTEDWSGPAVPPPAGDQALPEPAALLLLAAGGALLTTRRR